MTEADVIQPSASIASTGLGLRYIGNHCYAYSGAVSDAGSGEADTTLLDFKSGAGYIIANMRFFVPYSGTNAYYLTTSMNEILIMSDKTDGSDTNKNPLHPIFIIPPQTHFIVKWGIDTITLSASVLLTGEVYGAE